MNHHHRRNGQDRRKGSGLLSRLRRDTGGNVMAMVGAAFVPLALMVGASVDLTRGYVAKSRLQQACDAGALAARKMLAERNLGEDNALPQDVIAQGDALFNANFPQEFFGAQAVDFQMVADDAGNITATAEADIPTSVLKMFDAGNLQKGFAPTPLQISAACEASFSVPNLDIMFVFDTTGSMRCAQNWSASYCSSNLPNSERSDSRLEALRDATRNFYDAIMNAATAESQVRFGFMPYSSTVNVGRLVPAETMWGTDSGETYTYQTRRLMYRNITGSSVGSEYRYPNSSSTVTSISACSSQVDPNDDNNGELTATENPSGWYWPSSSGSSSTPISNTSTTTRVRVTAWRTETSGSRYRCFLRNTTQTLSAAFPFGHEDWSTASRVSHLEFGAYPMDVSGFLATSATTTINNPVRFAGASDNPATTTRWNGCIHEAPTVATSNFASGIPAGARDMDIDLVPAGNDRWAPFWPDITYERGGTASSRRKMNASLDLMSDNAYSSGWWACPNQALRLTEFPLEDGDRPEEFDDYLDDLEAVGGTYHGIGLVWGARFMSPNGIFAADNQTAANGGPIQRHLIFMTDGDMSASTGTLTAWGVEDMDRKVWGSGGGLSATALTDRHNARFDAICTSIRGSGVTLWVVAFGSSLNANLVSCADNEDRDFQASNAEELNQAFATIAARIGFLRLTS